MRVAALGRLTWDWVTARNGAGGGALRSSEARETRTLVLGDTSCRVDVTAGRDFTCARPGCTVWHRVMEPEKLRHLEKEEMTSRFQDLACVTLSPKD